MITFESNFGHSLGLLVDFSARLTSARSIRSSKGSLTLSLSLSLVFSPTNGKPVGLEALPLHCSQKVKWILLGRDLFMGSIMLPALPTPRYETESSVQVSAFQWPFNGVEWVCFSGLCSKSTGCL